MSTAQERSVEVEAAIRDAWDAIADLEEHGRISPNQIRYLVREEPDDDAAPMVRSAWLTRLHAAIERPAGVGVNLDTYACPACLDVGQVENDAGAVKPCHRCHPAQYAMWRDHWKDPKHRCERCYSRPRRIPTPDEQRATDEATRQDHDLANLE